MCCPRARTRNLQNCAEFWLDALSLSLLGFSFLVLWNLNWNIWPQGSLIHQNCQSDNSSVVWAHKNDFQFRVAFCLVGEKREERGESEDACSESAICPRASEIESARLGPVRSLSVVPSPVARGRQSPTVGLKKALSRQR